MGRVVHGAAEGGVGRFGASNKPVYNKSRSPFIITNQGSQRRLFARQALSLVWDFSKGNPFVDSTGNYGGAVDWIADVVDAVAQRCREYPGWRDGYGLPFI